MNSLWPSRATNEASSPSNKPEEEMDAANIGPEQPNQLNPPQPVRPLLQRNSSAQPPPPAMPPPPNQPPPPPVGNAPPPPSDSLSLAQLRRIVAEFPRTEAVAYDFAYEDMGPIDEEIDEWFVYQFWQWVRLNAAQRAFELQWEHDFGTTKVWDEVDDQARTKFVSESLGGLSSGDPKQRLNYLGRLVYIVLGRWASTAGGFPSAAGRDRKARSASTPAQLVAMKAGAKLIGDAGGVVIIWDALRRAFDPFWYVYQAPYY